MSQIAFSKLPPLHALAAFEAVARLQSFARAADELCVTHGAVSHRIRLLEEHFGTRLLLRRGGSVALTTKGTYLLTAVLDALSTLQEASERLSGSRPVARISAGPSSAHNWLMHLLGAFYREHPDIDLEISATKLTKQKQRASVECDEVDVAVRYSSREDWAGLACVKLMDVTLFPVCSPAYREALGGIRTVADLRKAVLLRLPHEPWQPWFEAAGLQWPEPSSGPLFGDASLMLDAAANGQGVALARSVLVGRDLESARLVRLFDVAIPSARSYYAVCSPDAATRPEIDAFIAWLIASTRGGLRKGTATPHASAPRRDHHAAADAN
jgi:LysR family glycine cleavage system transcriptional activator